MKQSTSSLGDQTPEKTVQFYGGMLGALFPFLALVIGIVVIALSGAPDEKGFWPILLGGLILSLFLARNKTDLCEVIIRGMSQPIVMIMIMAWMLASIIGVLMKETGFIEALIWIANQFNLGGISFIVATFLICCAVSTSTGTSFGTILICGPLLFPAGGVLGSDLPTLAGAILGGATFGDNISPISDTTIASALSQKADIGGVVRSRLKYSIPAASIALICYAISASIFSGEPITSAVQTQGAIKGLPMLLVPVLIVGLLLGGRHLLQGLFFGLTLGVAIGLIFGLLPGDRLLALDRENFTATSFIIEGINRGLGISVFTIFLMGQVAALKASGVLNRLVQFAARSAKTAAAAEVWIVGVVGGALLLTCHGVVGILTAADFARETGERFNIHPYRRANLLDVTASTIVFILPYFLPVILTASVTSSGSEYGLPTLNPLEVGTRNFYSWILLLILMFSLGTGYGRRFAADR